MDSTGTQTREPGDVQINGTVVDGFEPVRDAFAVNFAERGEIGASFAVVAGGEPVVNLWAGWADPEAGLAMAYVMNRMGMNLVDDPRKMALLDAVYASVR